MKSTISLDVTCMRRIEQLPSRHDPVQNHTLETFGVISPSAGSTFLDLRQTHSLDV